MDAVTVTIPLDLAEQLLNLLVNKTQGTMAELQGPLFRFDTAIKEAKTPKPVK